MIGLSGKAKLAGIMAWPVGHSLSPRLHGYWLDHYGIDGTYIPLGVEPSDIEQVLKALPKMGFAGLNVSVPHKEAVMAHMDHVDDNAKRIGAVNTIVFDQAGKKYGSNTDGYGFIQNILARYKDWDFASGPAVVLGAGGAARAVCVALLDAGAPEIRLLNRTRERADVLASQIEGPMCVEAWEDRHEALAGASLVVNTSSLGMVGQPPLEIILDDLPQSALVTDIVYAPLKTGLLNQAALRSNPVVDGIGMLLHQARPGFKAWFGHDPEVTLAQRDHVLAAL